MPSARSRALSVAALVTVVAAVFAQAVGFPLLCWDDQHHVPARLSLLTRELGYPIPLTVASYALLGRSAPAVHAWNVVLHAGCVLAVWWLARALGLRGWRALAPALLFALHPIVAEPVAWATGRKDLLAALLVIVAVAAHVEKPRPLLTALLYALALAAKPSAVPLPAILWAHDRLRAPERKQAWLLALVPLAALDLWLSASGDRALGGISETPLEVWQRVPLAAGLEAGHLLAPVDLLPRYLAPSPPPVGVMVGGALALALLAGGPLLLRRRAPLAAFALAFAALAYLPASDLLHRTRFIADSYLYLPLAGLALVCGLARVPRWAPLVLCALYLPLSVAQTRLWRSNVTLFEPVRDAYPDSPTSWKQLGDSYVCDGRVAEAIAPYQMVESRLGSCLACGNLGLAWARLGDYRRAEAAFQRGAAWGDAKAAQHLSKLRQSVVIPPEP